LTQKEPKSQEPIMLPRPSYHAPAIGSGLRSY